MTARPELLFASPRKLPKVANVRGRVVVLDIAFAAKVGNSISFDHTTRPFIDGLGARLAMWIDHHDHERHRDFASDDRFVLATKAQHGACPEMVTPERVRRAGPVDTVVCHIDLDGLYAAAKWVRGGLEPYRGADDDARAVDTRTGTVGPIAIRIDAALRARSRDDELKRAVVWWLVDGMGPGVYADAIAEAAAAFAEMAAGTAELSRRFAVRGRIAMVDVGERRDFDKTDLLLAGQTRAAVAIVRDSGSVSIAAPFDSGWDFVALLGLGGGMPTRVSVPVADLARAVAAINAAPTPTPRARGAPTTPDE